MTSTRLIARTLLLSLLVLPPARALAQPTAVFLVHGLNSDGPAWQAGINMLQAEFPHVRFLAPTLGSFGEFITQAEKLRAAMWGFGPYIAIGHSNGGTVIRTAAYLGQEMHGAITLGSPQHGAPLADRAVDGSLVNTLDYWWGDIVRPVSVYGQFGWDFSSDLAHFMGGKFHRYVNPWMNVLYQYFAINLVTRQATNNVVQSMGTAGWAALSLGTPALLAREAQNIPRRYSIIYRFLGAGVMWKGLTPQFHNSATTTQYMLAEVYASNYEQYVWYDDYSDFMSGYKRAYAWLWALGAYQLANTDAMWCGLVDGWTAAGECDSDGIVPAYSQYWPNATPAATVYGLGHMEETSAPASMSALAGVLRGSFGVH